MIKEKFAELRKRRQLSSRQKKKQEDERIKRLKKARQPQ
jgi:hypothetical protein